MKLQTQIKLQKQQNNLIDYNSKLLLLGSCFSENIGNKFEYFKFQSKSNPFGILFHPKAIENLIVRAIKQEKYTENDIFFHNEQWHCFDAHSQLSNVSKEKVLNTLNTSLEITNKQLLQSSHIIITLGTAWVYSLIESKKTVANCHKVPQKEFEKRILAIEEITKSLKNIAEAIIQKNKTATLIFTVSPVRHIKDGFVENTQSKAHLITAIHQFINQKSPIVNIKSFYFPSFEIMLDELRDYRFYKTDMLHPNTTAIDYIWQKFLHVWMALKTVETMAKVEVIQKGLLHKPFNESSKAHQKFLQQLKEKQDAICVNFQHITF